MDSGVATRPIQDWDAYIQGLNEFVGSPPGMIMKPVFCRLLAPKHRFAEGEDERVLRAVQVVRDEGTAMPVLIGRHAEIPPDRGSHLRIREGEASVVHSGTTAPSSTPITKSSWTTYHRITGERNVDAAERTWCSSAIPANYDPSVEQLADYDLPAAGNPAISAYAISCSRAPPGNC